MVCIGACKCFITRAPGDSYPWEVQEMEESVGSPTRTQAPDCSAAWTGDLGHCPSLGLSLPICIMNDSDDMSANSTLRDPQMTLWGSAHLP